MFNQLYQSLVHRVNCNAIGVLASPLQKSSGLTERGLPCPPGHHCGHGPVCAPPFCELPGCENSAACQDASDASLKERSTDHPKSCDMICIEGPDGRPVCGCNADSKGAIAKREDRFCLQICDTVGNGEFLCGCALADYLDAHPDETIGSDGAPSAIATREPRVCTQICETVGNGQFLCGCALADYKIAHPGETGPGAITEREVKRCPQFCITTDDGKFLCGCAALEYEKSHQTGTGPVGN